MPSNEQSSTNEKKNETPKTPEELPTEKTTRGIGENTNSPFGKKRPEPEYGNG
nr:hypothetical protein [uncultured Rhodococcus sp.]